MNKVKTFLCGIEDIDVTVNNWIEKVGANVISMSVTLHEQWGSAVVVVVYRIDRTKEM